MPILRRPACRAGGEVRPEIFPLEKSRPIPSPGLIGSRTDSVSFGLCGLAARFCRSAGASFLTAHAHGNVSLLQARAALAHVLTAAAIQNEAEVRAWLEPDRLARWKEECKRA